MSITSADIASILALGNVILSSAIVIIAFSLVAYILTHNFRSGVARGFLALLTFIMIVYGEDVVASNVVTSGAALGWLRFQWLGIAFVPAAYLQFSDAVLRNTGSGSRWRGVAVFVCYLLSLGFFLLAAFTDLVVRDGVVGGIVAHLEAGPLFWIFALYFGLTTVSGLRTMQLARQRCLTSTSRRRMTYLGLASVAPVMGLFPYMLIALVSRVLSPNWILLFSLIGNAGVAFMTVVMGYAVAYHGVLTPDRVIKHSMIHYLLRGPLVGIGIIALMLIVPRVEDFLGLPRDTVLIFTVTIGIVLFQVLITVAKPYVDRLIYREDREEMAWIQALDQRLFTTTDLAQLLENLLTAVCDLLRVRTGFLLAREDEQLQIRAFCGPRDRAELFLSHTDWSEVVGFLTGPANGSNGHTTLENGSFVLHNGYWLVPLKARDNRELLGLLGIEAHHRKMELSAPELETISDLVTQAARALTDTRLQHEVFRALQRLASDIEDLQRLRSTPHYAQTETPACSQSPVEAPDFPQWVKEALTDYWGGPRLSRSPLIRLKLVELALDANDQVAVKALRSVLLQAMERLKPAGERKYTATEWLIYNILELRFLRGVKTREVAQRLAISESDFYRKQRVAINEVSRMLADMERSSRRNNGSQEETPPAELSI